MCETPTNSPTSSNSGEEFPEDTSPIEDSEPEEGESTKSFADKLCQKLPVHPSVKPFKFQKFLPQNTPKSSPSSSPIPLPSPDPILIISSDEELENSMVKLEEAVSLEMDSD